METQEARCDHNLAWCTAIGPRHRRAIARAYDVAWRLQEPFHSVFCLWLQHRHCSHSRHSTTFLISSNMSKAFGHRQAKETRECKYCKRPFSSKGIAAHQKACSQAPKALAEQQEIQELSRRLQKEHSQGRFLISSR